MQKSGLRPTSTSKGKFCRLAAALYGNRNGKGLQHECRKVLKDPPRTPAKAVRTIEDAAKKTAEDTAKTTAEDAAKAVKTATEDSAKSGQE